MKRKDMIFCGAQLGQAGTVEEAGMRASNRLSWASSRTALGFLSPGEATARMDIHLFRREPFDA